MPYHFSVEPKPGYLHVKVNGDSTPETLSAYLRDVHTACEKTGCPRVLIEENLVGPSMSVADIFQVISERAAASFPIVRTLAFVDTNPLHDQSIAKFAETVGVNRGIHGRVFAKLSDAEAWLHAMSNK